MLVIRYFHSLQNDCFDYKNIEEIAIELEKGL